jgi:hypothetical protein
MKFKYWVCVVVVLAASLRSFLVYNEGFVLQRVHEIVTQWGAR